MARRLLCISFIFLWIGSCAWTKDVFECIRYNDIQAALPALEKIADSNARAAKQPITETATVEKSCHKAVYSRSGSRIILFSTPDDPDTSVRGSIATADKKNPSITCFASAQTELRSMGRPAYQNVLAEHKKRWDWLWNDTDIGPVKWLNCEDTLKKGAWSDGLSTMVHEMNHENILKNCLYFPRDGQRLCFDLPEDLPKAEFARLDHFPLKDPDEIKNIESLENMYLTDENEVLFLFDEVNAYILTTQVYTDRLKKFGLSGIMQRGTRSVIYLPMIMWFSKRYLQRLRAKDPTLYARVFTAAGTNMKNLQLLFSEGEAAFGEFKLAMHAAHYQELAIEAATWDQYRSIQL